MEFFEMKALAKKAGMEVKTTTKKVDVENWLDENEEAVAAIRIQEEAKVDVEVPEVGETFEVEAKAPAKKGPCPHQWVFTNIQAVRQPNTKDDQGNNRRGRLDYKDVYVCSLCGDKEIRDKSEREVVTEV